MEAITVKIKKLDKKAKVPVYSSAAAAGMDLYAREEGAVTIRPDQTVMIHTGIASEIPERYVGLVFARSGMAVKKGLAPANKVGVVDSDYRGELMIALHNHSSVDRVIEDGERVAQMVIMPVPQVTLKEAEELSGTERGDGGFGSTGTK